MPSSKHFFLDYLPPPLLRGLMGMSTSAIFFGSLFFLLAMGGDKNSHFVSSIFFGSVLWCGGGGFLFVCVKKLPKTNFYFVFSEKAFFSIALNVAILMLFSLMIQVNNIFNITNSKPNLLESSLSFLSVVIFMVSLIFEFVTVKDMLFGNWHEQRLDKKCKWEAR